MSNFYDKAKKISSNTLVLERTYYNGGTHGKLRFPTGESFDTLELPWVDNKQRVSCIPAAVYQLKKRHSPVVERSSGGEFKIGWEVTNVPNRTYIMIHPGNFVHNFLGCIGVGMSKGFHEGKPAVWNSRLAFRKVMALMEAHKEWELIIKPLPGSLSE